MSTKPIKLQKNVVVGTVSEVDQIAHGGRFQTTSEVDESFHINLPDHTVDLAERSTRHLTPEQSLSVKKLLMDFQDIFSIGNFDLGLFKGIQHRINTGNALPIKSKLRRTPLCFQTEEEHLKSMLNKGIIVPSASEWSPAPGLVWKKMELLGIALILEGLIRSRKEMLSRSQ